MKKLITLILITSIFLSGYTQDIETGLMARYSFCGNLNDESGNGNNGEFMGSGEPEFTFDQSGASQSAMLFNGIDSYVSISPSTTMNSPVDEATVSCWFNYISLTYGQWGVLCAKTNELSVASREYSLGFNSQGKIYWHSTYVAQTTLEANTWYHVAVTYTPEILKCYLNGVFIGEAVPNDPLVGNELPFEIGRDTPDATEIFHGTIDEVNVYNRALSPADVLALKNNNGCNSSSVQDRKLIEGISYYPNPVNSELTIILPDANNYSVKVYNTLGQIIYTSENQANSINIDISNIEKGIYFFNVSNQTGYYTNKFNKN